MIYEKVFNNTLFFKSSLWQIYQYKIYMHSPPNKILNIFQI